MVFVDGGAGKVYSVPSSDIAGRGPERLDAFRVCSERIVGCAWVVVVRVDERF